MSTQINQFLVWGLKMPYQWHKDWERENQKINPEDFYTRFQSFMDDSAFTETVNHKDGIFCLFDGRDGRFIIIGRVIQKSKDGEFLADHEPLSPPEFTELEKELLRNSVHRNFGIAGEFKFWFVTQFR